MFILIICLYSAAWAYVASGYNEIREECNTENSLCIFANNIGHNLDTYVVIEKMFLE